MTNSENNPFAGLPVSLVKDILDKSGHIANDIYEPFREITNNRDKLSEQLKQHDIINADSSGEGLEIPTSCCIDGYHTVEKFLTSDLACSAAFAVEGLVPPSAGRFVFINVSITQAVSKMSKGNNVIAEPLLKFNTFRK